MSALSQVKSEIAVLRHLYHRNVVLLFEVLDDPVDDHIFLVMEVQTHDLPHPIILARTTAGLQDRGYWPGHGCCRVPGFSH